MHETTSALDGNDSICGPGGSDRIDGERVSRR